MILVHFCNNVSLSVSDVAFFIAFREQLQSNRGCYVPMQSMFSEDFPMLKFNKSAQGQNLYISFN